MVNRSCNKEDLTIIKIYAANYWAPKSISKTKKAKGTQKQ